MSYFTERTAQRLILESDPNYWVEVIADFKWKETKQFITTSDGATIEFATTADKVLNTAIIGWNLDDAEGNVVPITQENIDRLEQDDVLLILNELNLEADSASKKNS